jgi:hypothetical protein
MTRAGWSNPETRWLLLAPEGAVPVELGVRDETVRTLRALPSGTPVAVAGKRGLRAVARQAEVDIDLIYLALPGTATPVAVAHSNKGLDWVAHSVLTVPPGRSRRHLAATIAMRGVRHAPWLLRAVGEHVLIGTRR